MKMRLTVTGEKEVQAEIARMSVRYPGAFAAALYSEGVGIYNEARNRVPVDSGYLRDSAYVTKPNPKAQNISLEVGFGAEHASLQHQKTEYRHTQGQAKYLQNTMEKLSPGFLQRLATATQKNVAAGIETVTAAVPSRKGSRLRGRASRASRAVGAKRR